MNFGIIRKLLGKIMILASIIMIVPIIVCIIFKESFVNYLSFIVPAAILALLGVLFNYIPVKDTKMQAREGFVIVALSWLIISLFGTLPFMISGVLPNFFDAFFEISSGFSTTGASVMSDVESLIEGNKSIFFFRSFSHWIGGMGILVFILAIIPESKEGSAIHILRAESPGPTVGKIASKMRASSRILYLIYIALTLLETIFLVFSPDMDLYEAIVHSFGTAGTGGFGIKNDSIASYSAYSQYVIAIFMLIFSINFAVYFLMLIGNFKDVLINEELRWFGLIVFISVSIVLVSLLINNIYPTFEETFRHSLFQVASIVSTTGYSTCDYFSGTTPWPTLCLLVIVILSFFGACAGSTAGGLKTSRIAIIVKSSLSKITNMVNPRQIKIVKMDKKPLSQELINNVNSYFIVYLLLLAFTTLIISCIPGENGIPDILTNFTASLSCLSNVGPGLGLVGPSGNYSIYPWFSKLILSLVMIAGRLELMPILLLFYPKTWLNR